jgi:TolB-like protein/class 3 adenylate cyclase/Tfp pilus assembly protein PilF
MDRQEHRVERRLAAIFAADVAGYSRLMSQDEVGTLHTLTAHREIMDRLIAEYGGRIANTAGDSVLAEFPSAVDAVQYAVSVQEALAQASQDTPEERRIQFRIGVHVGDVMVRGGDLLGDGVNIAARLESLANPGGICISEAAYRYVRKIVPLTFSDLGPQKVKNIEEPVRVYALKAPSPAPVGTEQAKSLPLPDKPSIAVLPFTNMSGDPEQEFFSDGIVEDIITALSRVRWFFVIARNSTFTYKGKAVDVRRVGSELGVQYVLEGSVRRVGNRIRVSAQLLDAHSGVHVWAEHYDRSLDDIFAVQDEITSNVVGAIEPQLVAAEAERAERRSTADLRAWECTMRALPHIWRLTRTEVEEGQGWLTQALQLDPDYAFAHALMGWSHMRLWGLVGTNQQREALERAEKSASTAALLDDREPWVHLVLGLVHARRRQPEQAIAALTRTLDLNPNFALAHAYLGYALGLSGRADAGRTALQQAVRLSPRDPFLSTEYPAFRVMIEFAAQNYEEVIRISESVIKERPDHIGAHRMLAASYGLLGQIAKANEAACEVLRLHPDFSLAEVEKASVYAEPSIRANYIEGLRLAGLPD